MRLPWGIQFVLSQIKKAGIDKFINEQLGSRGEAKTYTIADGVLSIHYSHLCGGSCIEDINTLNEHIGYHPGLSLTSSDTALRIMQELKKDDTIIQKGEVTHQFNQHDKLNDCLQKLAIKTNRVIATSANTLDYDNVILENEKADAS